MKAKEYLEEFKQKIDKKLAEYFKEKIKQGYKIDPLSGQAIEAIRDFVLAGGKRLRPAIFYHSYIGNGGEDKEEVARVAMAVELIHAFLLIHDDIIDRDDKRHGAPTVHNKYKKIGEKISLSKNKNIGEAEHFGNSMALMIGDMANSMANEIIFNSSFSPKLIIKALDRLQKIIYRTIPGEMIDILMGMKGVSTEKEILRMYEGKTAWYTFEGPIHLGWILADSGNEKNLKNLSKYATLAGIAFQIRDDILGIFGDEKKLGKPVGSDIIEGKQTLLVFKAKEKANQRDRNFLDETIGKKKLSALDLENFRSIIKRTGALEHSENLCVKMVKEARENLNKVDFKNRRAASFFNLIAEYIIQRQI